MAFCNRLNKSNAVLYAISIFKMLLYYVYGVHLNNLLRCIPDFADLVIGNFWLRTTVFDFALKLHYLLSWKNNLKICI